MIRRALLLTACFVALWAFTRDASAQSPQAYGRQWGRTYSNHDWNRFYHYPYVYYPQNFWSRDYYKSTGDLYHRYVPEMQIPAYNDAWYNYYPREQRYYRGHHFILDVF